MSGEHAALARRFLVALGCKGAGASDRWLSSAGWLLTITVDGWARTFFAKQAEPDEWANLDLVVSAVRAVVGKERILEVATGEQTACFLCLPAAAETALRGAGYLRDRPRLSRARRNKNVVEVAAAELEALTGGGGKPDGVGTGETECAVCSVGACSGDRYLAGDRDE